MAFSYTPNNTFKASYEAEKNPSHKWHDLLCDNFLFKKKREKKADTSEDESSENEDE